MKKLLSSLFTLMFLAAFAVNVNAGCGISADPDQNQGHCRPVEGGECECFTAGSGPACNGTVIIIKKPKEIQE